MGKIRTTNAMGYTIADNTLDTKTSAPLASAPGFELHFSTMSVLGGYRVWLDINTERVRVISYYLVHQSIFGLVILWLYLGLFSLLIFNIRLW